MEYLSQDKENEQRHRENMTKWQKATQNRETNCSGR